MLAASRRLYGHGITSFQFFKKMAISPRPVFELRIYNMKLESVQDFLKLLGEYWSGWTAHSVGFWMSEIGGIAQAVHMWEYASLTERAAVRKILATDESWQKDLLKNFFPQANLMNNSLLALAPGTTLNTNFEPLDTAVYELHICDATRNWPPSWAGAGETLVGHFTGIYGPTGTDYLLYRYIDMETACAGAVGRRSKNNINGYSRLMTPSTWSALK